MQLRRSSSLLLLVITAACGPSSGPQAPVRPPLAQQWYERARVSYKGGDFDDARESVRHAMSAAPNDAEIRTLDGRVALAHLDFAEALKLTEGVDSTDAHAIRGRAHWFLGDLDQAADDLEALLQDPTVKDPWARDVAVLARQGVGRHPFEMQGGMIGVVDMPRAIGDVPLGSANVVPCELDGERILALVATATSEVILDSNARRDPAWVTFRFGDRLEVKDVPALTQDLTALSHQVGVPIKALLGANLLRHAHVTIDRRGDQFVVRRQEAPPPPEASRVPLFYIRGGGMMMRANVTAKDQAEVPFLVDSSRIMPLFLTDGTWQKAGVDVKTLVPMPEAPNVRRGLVPTFRLAGYDLARLPALQGGDLGDLGSTVDIDLAGIVGADLLSFFRVTFADEGRSTWVEPDPMLLQGAGSQEAHPPSPAPAPPTTSPATPPPPPPPAPPVSSAASPGKKS